MTDRRRIFFLIFTLSGFSGLIYESIWTHYLKLFLGHAAYAQTLVLAIFMGGLTVGSWICSRYSGGWRNLLRGYAVAEAVIGLLALGFHPLFDTVVQYSYAVILPSLDSPAAVNAFKWTLSACMIMPQTVLLGMTFPLMTAGLLRRYPDTPGRLISILYFTNSIGAATGVLVSGFVLIRALGLPGTIVLAGTINIGLAAAVWLLTREGEPVLQPATGLGDAGGGSRSWYRILLAASLVTGAASFIYEIAWIRMLSLVLGSSTHSFELMLSAFIFGIAFGGLWLQRRIDAFADPVRFLVYVQVAMGLLAMATLPLYEQSFAVMSRLLSLLPRTDTGYALFNLSSNAIALAVMLPATFCAGMTMPLITASLIRKGHGEKSIGAVYAMNTIGAIIGVFAAVHLGMPLLGIKNLITVGGSLDMLLGLVLLWAAGRGRVDAKRLAWTALLCITGIVSTLFLVSLDPFKMASGVYRTGALLDAGTSRLLYHRDGKTATVSVTEETNGTTTIRSIRTNGKPDAAINMNVPHVAGADEATMILAGALPMAYHPGAKTAANIGLGSGLTTHTLLCNPSITEVDTIEIEREMVEGARHFGIRNELAFSDPRSRIPIEDAKTFFSSQNRKYDIIVSEPSNPWVSGVAGLFSREFYELVSQHLDQQGVFVQWIHLYEIDVHLVATVFKALEPNFRDFVVYSTNYGDLLIVARNEGQLSSPDPGIFAIPRLAEQLRLIDIRNMQDVEMRRVGDRSILTPYFGSLPLPANSDYYPVLDQGAARTRFLGSSAQSLIRLSMEPLPVVEMLTGTARPGSVTDVSPSTVHPKARTVQTAMALRDYYVRNKPLQEHAWLDAETRTYAEQVRKAFRECRSDPDPNRRVFLFNTAKSMIPYLAPTEADAIWSKLGSGHCDRSFTMIERAYLSLFKAIGRRDGSEMARQAKFLLAREQDVSPARMKYLVAAAMLGELSTGKGAEAGEIWKAYQPYIVGDDQQLFLFRFLDAQGSGHSSGNNGPKPVR